jgi:hypothetical protein
MSKSAWINEINFVAGVEVITAVVMKSYIFWDIFPCSPLKGNVSEEYFDSTIRFKEKAKQETSVKQVANRASVEF